MKILAVSDIHARCRQFKQLIEPKIQAVDKIVLCGDYVGYGTEPVEMVEELVRLKEEHPEKVVLLRGNWEDMMYSILVDEDLEYKSCSDCIETVQGRYNGQFTIDALSEHVDEFLKLYDYSRLWYDVDDYLFVHAGISMEKYWYSAKEAIENSSVEDFLWSSESFIEEDFARLPFWIVGGHVPFCFYHDEESPYVLGRYINIDFRASSNYGRLGYVIFDTATDERSYKAISVKTKRR